jgi:small subunit ribosomal protein S7
MSRRRRADRRVPAGDPRFGSVQLASFINRVMLAGKKTVAQRAVYQALDAVGSESNRDPLEVFEQALRNVTPNVEVKPRRVGGATYQVPVEVPERRRNALAMRWLIRSARARTGQPMRSRLAAEIMDASRGQGAAARRREEMHRMAEANRAFVHYRW